MVSLAFLTNSFVIYKRVLVISKQVFLSIIKILTNCKRELGHGPTTNGLGDATLVIIGPSYHH